MKERLNNCKTKTEFHKIEQDMMMLFPFNNGTIRIGNWELLVAYGKCRDRFIKL